MCGITGIWNGQDQKVVREMMRRLVHRGPDANGVFKNETGVFGHQRLSIMDPKGGDQPICDDRNFRAIVGNGEIYNFPTLKPQLEKGHRFRTRSDTESALHLYEDHGTECARRLDGMFAFAIADGDKMYAARVVAKHLDTIHHEHVFTRDDVMDKLPEILFHLESFDRDLVRSAIPCYFTSRLAAQHLKVILTGEGADELFGGYTYYKDINCEKTLHNELRRSIAAMHNVNLQRVDRLTMAHSLEGRVPFLDSDMIELAQTIPTSLKLVTDDNGQVIEKWVLRKACEDLLPDEIVWRKKLQFDEGSGTVDIMGAGLEQFLPEADANSYLEKYSEANLRCHEEVVYHKLLHEAYDGDPVVMKNVGRWADRPV